MIHTVNLLCNFLKNPIGVDDEHPGFSWQMVSDESHQAQSAYQICVFTQKNKVTSMVWDSGWVVSDECIDIAYEGERLLPRTCYFWQLRQKDSNGNEGSWSERAFFETGLMGEYLGQWIGNPGTRPIQVQPAPMLRKSFQLPQRCARGRIYICGLGYHVLYVNGKRLGDGVLNPGVSRYDKTVYYETIDVTSQLLPGENVLGVVVGSGWYNRCTEEQFKFHDALWKGQQKLWLEGHFELENGQEIVVVSDGSWKVCFGPYRMDQLRNGETYDARMEIDGWTMPGCESDDFMPVQIKRTPGGILKSQQFIPIRRITTLKAVEIKEVQPNVWVYDFGKNITGFIRINAKGYRDSELTFRYSERVNEDGTINREKLTSFVKDEFQTDHYIMKGDALEQWAPEFTYHGFRYVEITGYPGTHTAEAFQADVVYTDFSVNAGFKCSDEMLNKLYKATLQSALTNFHGIPTDCPHREKNGWLGDSWLTAEHILTNFDARTLYRKWLNDIVDAQRPDGYLPGMVPATNWGYNRNGTLWGVALILIPWYQYVLTADKRILKENYPAMQKFFHNLQMMEQDGIICMDGEVWYALADWMPPGGNDKRVCPSALSETAAYYQAAVLLSEIGKVVGDKINERKYKEKADYIKSAFRKTFFSQTEELLTSVSQTGYGTVLFSGLAEQDEVFGFLDALVNDICKNNMHFNTGYHGTKFVLHTLMEYERSDLAYEIITKTDYPGFGYMITHGATTLWEDWEGGQSQNHPSFGDVSTFFFQGLAGIRYESDYPGYKKFKLKPYAPKNLDRVEAWQNCPYGKIESSWERKSDKIEYHCQIPANTEAELILFDGSRRVLGSGSYTFIVNADKKMFEVGK